MSNDNNNEAVTVQIYKDIHERLRRRADQKGMNLKEYTNEALKSFLNAYDAIEAQFPNLKLLGLEDGVIMVLDKANHEVYTLDVDAKGLICKKENTRSCVHISFFTSFPEAKNIIENQREKKTTGQ